MLENPYPAKCDDIYCMSARCKMFKLQHDTWQEGSDATIRYLNKPCKEHSYAIGKQVDDFFMVSDVKYPKHRKDCPECWKELSG